MGSEHVTRGLERNAVIGIVLDGLRVPGAGHAELPAIVEP